MDAGIQYERGDWKFGLMVRDITTTFNIWTIDEDAFATIQCAIPGQNQELPGMIPGMKDAYPMRFPCSKRDQKI